MTEPCWPALAVMGAGAVGCYFGGMLARAGAPVTLIGRAAHVEAMSRDGLLLEIGDGKQRVPVSASTSAEAVRSASIVLFCVKTLDTETAAQSLAPHLAAGAVVVSMQNGVDNVQRIRAAAGIDAIPAVVYVGAQMAGPGWVKHTARGELVIGDLAATRRTSALEALAALFNSAGIPCQISSSIEADLWTKMIINCSYNAMSALGGEVPSPHRQPLDARRHAPHRGGSGGRGDGLRVFVFLKSIWCGRRGRSARRCRKPFRRRPRTSPATNGTEIDALNGYVVTARARNSASPSRSTKRCTPW